MHRTKTPPIVMQGPLTRARARQLNQQVSSFLCSNAYTYEDGMLPNSIIDYIVLRNFGEEHEGFGNQRGRGGKKGGRPSQDGGPIQFGISHLGLPELSAPKSSARPQTDTVLGDPCMVGKIKT